MNAERIREFLLGLPHVVETEQWGGVVFWVGDKAVGGKMFAMMNPDGGEMPMSYPAGPERFVELQELDGIRPAPYMARIFWVSVERWDVFRMGEWEQELTAAHARTFAKLPPRTKAVLALPKAEFKKLLGERRKLLAERAKSKSKSPSTSHMRSSEDPALQRKGTQETSGEASKRPRKLRR
jgi:predicted DNA-binding protein (MmcQ/YjbR family)